MQEQIVIELRPNFVTEQQIKAARGYFRGCLAEEESSAVGKCATDFILSYLQMTPRLSIFY